MSTLVDTYITKTIDCILSVIFLGVSVVGYVGCCYGLWLGNWCGYGCVQGCGWADMSIFT